jgi:hypothetical protein
MANGFVLDEAVSFLIKVQLLSYFLKLFFLENLKERLIK